jgi:translation initiation factor 1
MDPFGVSNGLDLELGGLKEKIHIRYYKKGPRAVTMIEGLDEDLDQKRIAKALKNTLKCASSVHMDKNHGEVIKLQGEHCQAVKEWLVAVEILTQAEAAERVVIHGI